MKLKEIYICQNCNYETSKWTGKCPECESWNSFVEDIINVGKPEKNNISKTPRSLKIEAKPIQSLISTKPQTEKITSGIEEFDRVMGDNIIKGSLTLLSGEPGIGKSTLTLQIANNIAKTQKVLIISGEESIEQIGLRAKRLNLKEKNLHAINEFNLENILETIKKEKPGFVIIDSIQVISSLDIPSSAGSVNQIRYCTEQIMELAKTTSTPVMLIGHVTKDGTLAGPRVLEHLVDTVLHIEGDRFQQFRILRSAKNRFGSCSEVGIFEMTEKGMTEIKNPSAQFLEGRKENAIGSIITITIEGSRPILVEVQALVSTSPFGYPKRTANGFDLNRLQILIAVLEKYGRLNLSELAADLAVLIAIASSFLKKPLQKNTAVFGEVGLSGELRKVSHAEKRLKEGENLGFTDIISPKNFKEIIEVLRKI
jgi:DNA repair protein RadA/Sms